MSKDPIYQMAEACLNARTRTIARVLTKIYDDAFRDFGINSAQFALLIAVFQLQRPSRSEIGRFTHQERSTLTRTIQPLLDIGWLKEVETTEGGRARPVEITATGVALLRKIAPAWQAAQEEAKVVLGTEGVTAIQNIGDDLFYFSGQTDVPRPEQASEALSKLRWPS